MSYAPFPNEAFQYAQITATTTLKRDPGVLRGIFVSAASSTPTITVYDNTAASGAKIVDTFTPVAATFYSLPAKFATALTVAVGGTVSATPFYL